MIHDTLTLLETWYNEESIGPERPKLLSKLALLELCGWLEGELDRIILSVNDNCLKNPVWIQKEVIDRTNGFEYARHFRKMLATILGEHLTCKLEHVVERSHPGDLDKLKSFTKDLWVKRCSFAHSDIAYNIQTQQRFDAPSWSQNQQRIISKILLRMEVAAISIAQGL